MLRRWAGVYSSSAVGNLERSMPSLGVMTILPRWKAASTRSPSEMPARDRSLMARVIWPLRWIFTIRVRTNMLTADAVMARVCISRHGDGTGAGADDEYNLAGPFRKPAAGGVSDRK